MHQNTKGGKGEIMQRALVATYHHRERKRKNNRNVRLIAGDVSGFYLEAVFIYVGMWLKHMAMIMVGECHAPLKIQDLGNMRDIDSGVVLL